MRSRNDLMKIQKFHDPSDVPTLLIGMKRRVIWNEGL